MDSMSPTAAKVPDFAQEITDRLVERFAANLHSVFLYGSSQHSKEYWDLDILVVLKANELGISDLEGLRLVADEFSGQSLDLQVLYLDELSNPETFSLDAHGAFFSRILQRAVVLYGENPFNESYVPSRKTFLTSLITRIQRYVFHARQEYILGGRHNKDRNPRYHQKHVVRAMFDVLLMSSEWLEPEEVKKLFTSRFPGALTAKDESVLDSMSDDIEDYILLYEKVYAVALKEVSMLLASEKAI